MKYKITFFDADKTITIEAKEGSSLAEASLFAGLDVETPCGGRGTCGKCRMEIREDKKGKWKQVLACQYVIHSAIEVRGHWSARKEKADIAIPEIARKEKNDQGAVADTYGVAVDLGTTTVVVLLWDLQRQVMIDSMAQTNPQTVRGADVISRIQYCMKDVRRSRRRRGEADGVRKEEAGSELPRTRELQSCVIECINTLILSLCERHKISARSICEMTVVGNTTMSHLFLGISPAGMARAPFSPAFAGAVTKRAGELGIFIDSSASVYLLPNIAGHVGSDLTGVLLASNLFSRKGNTVILDIGTNGEIFVAKDGVVLTCSTAAGPAFEGAGISCGMRARNGAIEGVQILRDTVVLKTIGEEAPLGLCGSGLIDLMAELLRTGLMNENGNLLSKEEAQEAGFTETLCGRLSGQAGDKCFWLTDDIFLSQKDIREVQLAKGAMLGGMLTLMHKLDMTEDTVDCLMLAGAFGNYIKKESAVAMGLLPRVPIDRITAIGNAAGAGASMALLSDAIKRRAEEEADKVIHVELSLEKEFEELYIQGMLF